MRWFQRIRFLVFGVAAILGVMVFSAGRLLFAVGEAGSYRVFEPVQNTRFHYFSDAKKALYRVSAATRERSFYCSCEFDYKTRSLNPFSCGYVARKNNNKRALRIEAEHVVPAARLCGETVHWKTGAPECVNSKGKPYRGRKCAQKYHLLCRRAMNDLRNLRPVVGEINQDRAHFHFGEIAGERHRYGACDFEVRANVAEPSPQVRGDIARTYLFMAQAYPELFSLSLKEEELYRAWSTLDPVSLKECLWNEEIMKEQGAANTQVQKLCDLFKVD